MNDSISEALDFVENHDVKFIRLAFCDIFGQQKNIAIMPHELSQAFEQGVSFDASSVRGFMNEKQDDLFLIPEPDTLTAMPWRALSGRVMRYYCHIYTSDGRPFAGDSRQLLKNAVKKLSDMGYSCRIGVECEFYLLKADAEGEPTEQPQDHGGYCDTAPLDRGENIRREIDLTLEEMGIYPMASFHEQGPGQNEVDFRANTPLTAADQLMAFKTAVKAIASQNGLFASFMPKLFQNYGGNGMHTRIAFTDRLGRDLFIGQDGELTSLGSSFIAGIIDHIREITLFLNSTANSYSRFGDFEAPKYISWSKQNCSQLIKLPNEKNPMMELRSPDMRCNPYIAFALLIEAGLDGIRRGLPLGPCTDRQLDENDEDGFQSLPLDLKEAIKQAENSAFVKEILPEKLLQMFLEEKNREWKILQRADDKKKAERELYFYND